MRNLLVSGMGAVLAAVCLYGPGPVGEASRAMNAEADEVMIAHDVYFKLKDASGEAKEALIAACKKYLSKHAGTVWFAAGTLVDEHRREVNDRGFDVALHIVFKDKASHDKYQQADSHHKFIEEFQQNWDSVRVFDSYLNVSSHGEAEEGEQDRDEAKKPVLPDPAVAFAGMIRGKVVAKYDAGEFSLAVEEVTGQWRHSKAEDANSLVGKTVLVDGRKENGRRVARFIGMLKIGETVTLDVAHRGKRETLTILELTEEQRERVK